MFEILVTVFTLWLFVGAVKLAFKITWCATKIFASVLLSLSVPVLILCLTFTSGAVILLPAFLIAGAFATLKCCV